MMFMRNCLQIKDMKVFRHILLLLLVVCFSCEKSIDYQLKNQKSEIVMYAFPMPDSILKVHGSATTNILSVNNYEGVEGMQMSIVLDEEKVMETEYPYGQEWYEATGVKGQEKINVELIYETKNGLIVSGKTVIPEAVKIVSIDTVSVDVQNLDNEEERMLRCYIEFNDPPNELNYYQVRVDSEKQIKDDEGVISESVETIEYIKEDKVFSIRDDESVLLTDIDFQGSFNDFVFDGSNYKLKILIPQEYHEIEDGAIKQSLKVHLYSITEDYYRFLRSSISEEAYREYPFFERVNVYSNVTNGLGVVAGLSLHMDSVSLFNSEIEPF
ncbi:DUF4249 domain-containing protein [Labilibacter sediminis]|nr:DUF4249 domain-containing protein [Labilibacter sediminis]